ncbi:Gfo/Idh/MocA family protein [Cellulophaga sp. Z1A5H]|uniref:Gfo/Idh/MocA family protein n=1 Tax=Cellulophaga sp. Z1A5H TaxID=2687291 RepID=UPI0013FD88C4|nr:Gfo/Idh/MocA family oxidoreductase [Cellulophaga sp. Z1A5H]
MKQKLRWGIVGLGSIANHFVKDLALVEASELVAVASRNLDKAQEFSKTYASKYAFGSYEELFKCTEVDVIYIATPHSFHAKIAIDAMYYGKHILCEKPLGVNTAEVVKMFEAAKENNVFLMEALWSRFNPSIQKITELIAEGVIGGIKYVHADFAFPALHRDDENRLLNPNLAGGSLLDIGIYPVFLAYLLLGKPDDIMASSKFYKTGVEMQTAMIFDYPDAQAVLYSGLNSKSAMKAEISGTKGAIYINPRWHEAQGFELELNEKITKFDLPTKGRGYYYEILEVQNCIGNKELESTLWNHEDSRSLIGLLDSIRAKTGVVFPFEE